MTAASILLIDQVCSVPGCGGSVLARGWCGKHYQRWAKHGDPERNDGKGSGRRTHGGADTPLYNVWMSMRARCRLPSDTNYQRYGARGIRVCPEWQESFVVFREWANANGYGPGLSIDRIDTLGNYEPSNCRWSTRKVQNRNTRLNVTLTAFGESKTIADWAEDDRCTVTYGAIRYRLKKGWPQEQAIATPRTQKGGPS